jgi:hypothetical protein
MLLTLAITSLAGAQAPQSSGHNRVVLQTGIEAFNLANHTNPARVSQFYAAGGVPLSSYGHAIETLNARQVQFMIQFEY